jgi:predicted  nucleic acid-binding Zn-ribbon protein
MNENAIHTRIKKLSDEIRSYRNAMTWADTENAKKWLQSSIDQCQREIQDLRDEESGEKS